jgi:hypothetical protein
MSPLVFCRSSIARCGFAHDCNILFQNIFWNGKISLVIFSLLILSLSIVITFCIVFGIPLLTPVLQEDNSLAIVAYCFLTQELDLFIIFHVAPSVVKLMLSPPGFSTNTIFEV